MSTKKRRPAGHGAAEKASGDGLSNEIVGESPGAGADFINCPLCLIAIQHRQQPQPPLLCGRCGGPAGPEGAWCGSCIRSCQEYTLQLDLSRLPELNSETLGWAAQFYARAGIPVFPLRPRDRVPLSGSRGVHGATTNLRQVREHWREHPDHNIGLACGVIFDVVDIDVKGGKAGLESMERLRRAGLLRGVWGKVTTPSGGMDLLFAPSDLGCPGKLGKLGVDFKGRGGYVIGTPSVTEVGSYRWDAVEPNRRGLTFDYEAAQSVLGVAKPKPAPVSSVTSVPSASGQNRRYVDAAIRAELEDLGATKYGQNRNDRLNDAAFNLGQFVGAGEVAEAEIEAALIETARRLDTEPSHPFPDSEIFKTVHSGLEAGKREPRKVPAPKLRLIPPPVMVMAS